MVKVCTDSWGIKKLFTYAIRKAGKDKPDCEGIPRRRETSFEIKSLSVFGFLSFCYQYLPLKICGEKNKEKKQMGL